MIDSLLVVLSRPHPGKDDEFNEWYSDIHLHDALRFRGSLAAQRFKLGAQQLTLYRNPAQWKYLAVYEVADTVRLTREHVEAMGTERMHISLAFDHRVAYDYYFSPCHFIDNQPGRPADGNVILQQIAVKPGRESEFRRWYGRDMLLPTVCREGVRSGALLQYRTEGQMLEHDPAANFVAIYRLSDLGAMSGWTGASVVAESALVDANGVETSYWEALTPRVTQDEVVHPTAARVAAEEKARERMGDKVIPFK
jgi:hypothetical protein